MDYDEQANKPLMQISKTRCNFFICSKRERNNRETQQTFHQKNYSPSFHCYSL